MLTTELIDSSVFLGMHSVNEEIRISCKNYFVERLQTTIGMSLEHIGGCDNIIWLYPRELQDAYYPFMDTLHTIMKMNRLPYKENDIKVALADSELQALSMYDRLLIAFAKNRKQVVYTVNKQLLNGNYLPVCHPEFKSEKPFTDFLEDLYQTSLKLRIPDSKLTSKYYNDSQKFVNVR
jgi:hypothetical protein